MPKSPQQVAKKWSQRLSQATEAIRDGINAVTVSPTEKAALRVDAYQAGVARAVADGSFVNGLRRVSLQAWKDAALNKGVARIAAGANAAVGKMETFLASFLPHVEAGKRMLDSMPRGDIEQNIARMVAMARHNAEFRQRS